MITKKHLKKIILSFIKVVEWKSNISFCKIFEMAELILFKFDTLLQSKKLKTVWCSNYCDFKVNGWDKCKIYRYFRDDWIHTVKSWTIAANQKVDVAWVSYDGDLKVKIQNSDWIHTVKVKNSMDLIHTVKSWTIAANQKVDVHGYIMIVTSRSKLKIFMLQWLGDSGTDFIKL